MEDWIDLAPQKTSKAGDTLIPVRFGLAKRQGARARGVILIRKEVIAPLKMETWRVNVRLGRSPERRHQLSIVPDKAGLFELGKLGMVKDGSILRLSLPVIESFPDIALPHAAAPHKIEYVGAKPILVIDLPAVCWKDSATGKLRGAA